MPNMESVLITEPIFLCIGKCLAMDTKIILKICCFRLEARHTAARCLSLLVEPMKGLFLVFAFRGRGNLEWRFLIERNTPRKISKLQGRELGFAKRNFERIL